MEFSFFDHFEEMDSMSCQFKQRQNQNLPEKQQEKQSFSLRETILIKNIELLRKKYGACLSSYFDSGFNP